MVPHWRNLTRDPRTSGVDGGYRLFLGSLGGGLGDLGGTTNGLLDGLDDTDSDGLSHVTDGETTQGRVVGESLNAHGLGGNHLDDGRVTRLDELGGSLSSLTGTAVDLLGSSENLQAMWAVWQSRTGA